MISNAIVIMGQNATEWMVFAFVLLAGWARLVMPRVILATMDQDASFHANVKTMPRVAGMKKLKNVLAFP